MATESNEIQIRTGHYRAHSTETEMSWKHITFTYLPLQCVALPMSITGKLIRNSLVSVWVAC